MQTHIIQSAGDPPVLSHLIALVNIQLRQDCTQSEDLSVLHSLAYRQLYLLPQYSWAIYRGCLVQRIAHGYRCEDPTAMHPVEVRDYRRGTTETCVMGQMCDRTFSMPALICAYIDTRLEEAQAA